MALTVEQIMDALAPAFSGDVSRPVFIELATARIAPGFYQSKTNHAIALMAAHMMALNSASASASGRGDEAGAITSKSEGDLSVSFGSTSANVSDAADLSQTKYGTQLIGLRKGCGPFLGVTGRPDCSEEL